MAYTTRFGKVVKLVPQLDKNLNVRKVAPNMPRATQHAAKGRFNGLCNRSACLRPGATWYNRGSYAFYCENCALMLNDDNRRDAYDLLGEGNELCIEIKTEDEARGLHVM